MATTNYKQNPDGTMAGSYTIGDGKTKVPTATPTPKTGFAALSVDDVASLASLHARFLAANGRVPVIGVDLDGTTADFTHGLRVHTAARLNVPEAEWEARFPNGSQYRMWQGDDAWYEDSAEFMDHFKEAESLGLYRTLDVYKHAPETLEALQVTGFKIRVVTARGADFNDDTRAWMRTHALPLEDITNANQKHTIPGWDVLLEDNPQEIEGCLADGKKIVIMNHAYNRSIPEHENARRITSWGPQLVTALESLLGQEKK